MFSSLTDLESLFCELCSLLLVHLHKLSAAPVPPGVWGQAGVPAPFLRCLPCCPCPAAPCQGPWAEFLLLPSTADRCHPRAALQWWCRKPMNKSQRERRRGGDVLQLLLPELLALLTPGSHRKAPGEDALSTGHRQAPGSCCQPPAHSHLVGWGLRVPGCCRWSCAGYGICPWGDTGSTGWTVTDQKFIYNKKKPTGN